MKTNKEIYQNHLKNTPIILRETINELETIIVNLAMSGELAEFNDQFDEDDSVMFKYEDFREVKDYNVNLIYTIRDFIEDKMREIINVNKLDEEID